ncbi:insulinase family protein, partial [PVC group bacterium]|nr:insulinase family protein [PVC group bacterium]
MPKDKLVKLSNGVRVVLVPKNDRVSTAIGIFADVGGRYEPKKLSGISHFIEHLVFKGTKTYSNRAIKEEIEGRGG